VAVAELQNKRRKTGKQIEREFKVSGYTDDDAARAALLASSELPATIGDYKRQDADCGVEEMGPGLWLGTGVWRIPDGGGGPEEPAINSFTVSVDISGQSQKITQALTHVADYAPAGKVARLFYGAIGVTPEGIEGADILVPQMSFTLNYKADASLITDEYIRDTIPAVVGCQNDDEFLGYDAGELLLTRVSGTKRYDSEDELWVWELSFGFSVSRNAEDLTIESVDGPIVIEDKRGWDYVWVRYEERTVERTVGSDTIKYTARVPVSAHVEQVYYDTDYDQLIVTP
jgi:hypothetical protein